MEEWIESIYRTNQQSTLEQIHKNIEVISAQCVSSLYAALTHKQTKLYGHIYRALI